MEMKYLSPNTQVIYIEPCVVLANSSISNISNMNQRYANLSLKDQIRKDGINVVVELAFLLYDSYIMILDYKKDQTLIKSIREEKMDIPELIDIASKRGQRVNNLLETMIELSKVVNDEDILLLIEEDGTEGKYKTEWTFFKE